MKLTKILSLCLVAVLLVGAFALVGCEEKKEQKVMTMSLNPEIEVILDEEGKVVTVNALNEEGNLIISSQAFVNVQGKSAEEVAELFMQVSAENGFLVTGRVGTGENQVEITISGDLSAAKELFDDVKATVDTYLSEENITATLTQVEVTIEEQVANLKAELAKCQPYLETAEMQYDQLVAELTASRKETAEMYSQELKNAYYEAKEFALEKAKLQAVSDSLDTFTKVAFDAATKIYVGVIDALEQARLTYLVNEDSIYQKALADFRTRKVAYLNYRNEIAAKSEEEVTAEEQAFLDNLKTALDSAEQALINAGVTANQAIDQAKVAVENAYTTFTTALNSLHIEMSNYVDQIAQKQTDTINNFCTEFETKYSEAISAAKNNWNQMDSELNAPTGEDSAQ